MHWHRYAAELGCTVEEAQSRVRVSEFLKWKRYRMVEPNNPPVTALQLALCASAVVNALGGETEPQDFLIEPFTHAYREAVQDGDLDDEDYVTTEPPRETARRPKPIVDLDS